MRSDTVRFARSIACAVFLVTTATFVVTLRADGCGSSACECEPPDEARWEWASGSLDCGAGAAAYCETACTNCYGAGTTSSVDECDDNPTGGLSIDCDCTPAG